MAEDVRFMWIMVFFDLPVTQKEQRRRAAKFRHELLNDGFMMLQYSVYVRPCRGQDDLEKHMKRVHHMVPKEGSIRALQVTDKQYGRMQILCGIAKKTEEIGNKAIIFL